MTESASYELQRAIIAALKADTAMKTVLGDPVRVYDAVPGEPEFPYASWGEEQILADDADCIDGEEIFVTLHVWARQTATEAERPLAKRILHRMRSGLFALRDAGTLTLSGYHLIEFTLGTPGIQVMRDPDGLTAHGTITFRALTEPV